MRIKLISAPDYVNSTEEAAIICQTWQGRKPKIRASFTAEAGETCDKDAMRCRYFLLDCSN